MPEGHALKRTRSLKTLFSARKIRKLENDESLPCRAIEQQLVQFHITSDDIRVRPTSQVPVRIPERKSSQRRTWPVTRRGHRAGSCNSDSSPHLTPTPWEHKRAVGRVRSRRPRKESKPLPRQIFEQLPREIYHCILEQHAKLHTRGTEVDVIGLQTDLKSLLLVNKVWHRLAREHLYREIWLPSNDELPKKAFSFRSKTRLKLLQKILLANAAYATMVRDLRVTADLAAALDSPSTREASLDILVDIIRLSPNLEGFSGYQPPLNDETDTKLIEALTGCRNLKAYAWNIREAQLGSGKLARFSPPDFLKAQTGWTHLDTLCICSAEDLVLGPGIISAALRRLPSLKHLMLAHLDRQDFHDGTLLVLPALRSLRLEHLAGITDKGLERFAYGRASGSTTRLTLVELEITSLVAIQSLLTNLRRLENFTFLQDTALEPQSNREGANRRPALASTSLQYLHWDVLTPSTATALLANSIASGRFPSLTKVKIPCDYDGSIQALCRPIAQESLSPDDLELIEHFDKDRYERFLRISQIQAQLRIRESRAQPSFNVVVEDENCRISATHVIGSYLGSMESNIEYSLEPDVEGSHYALIDFNDVEGPEWLYERRNEMGRSVKGEQILDLRSLF